MRAAVLTILVSYELLAQAPQPDPLMLEHNRALQLADQGHESEALEIILGVIKRAPLFQPAYKSLPDLAGSASDAGSASSVMVSPIFVSATFLMVATKNPTSPAERESMGTGL